MTATDPIIQLVDYFIEFGIGIGIIYGAITVIGDVFNRKSKKDEYIHALESIERIHASKKVAENAKDEKEQK